MAGKKARELFGVSAPSTEIKRAKLCEELDQSNQNIIVLLEKLHQDFETLSEELSTIKVRLGGFMEGVDEDE